MTDNSGITPFEHFDANRKNWGKANPSLRDNGGQLPTGITKITNTTGQPERILHNGRKPR